MHYYRQQRLRPALYTTNSKMLFQLLGLRQLLEIMISKHPFEWPEDKLFKAVYRLVKGLPVVNDRAERGVA